jgi:7,8-dihydro-6-hydroxymethylpterin dimethyltransferase
MSKAVKYAERTLTAAAQGAWTVFEKLNSIRPNASFTPKWSDKPLAPFDRFALSQVRA